jgi:uncharacterized radical SAM superfamily protein
MSLKPIIDAARQGRPITRKEAEAILTTGQVPHKLFEFAGRERDSLLGREIRFYYPLPRFPNVSVTGGGCALGCKHCGGHYLKAMEGTETPSKLKSFCTKLEANGGIGLLVSGGCDTEGRVPLDRFLGTLRWVKENTGLIVNVHTGLLDKRQAEEIVSTGVDIVSVDVVGSNETIRRVYGLNATVDDYRETLNSLKEAQVPHIVPHICVGLDFGKILGEAAALEVARGINPELVVILGLMPTPGTAMESVEPPSAEVIARAITATKLMFPKAGVALGCMRPRTEKGRIEEMAMRAGASRLVLPSRSTIEKTEAGGFRVMHLDGCCSIPVGLEARALRLGQP